MKLQTGTAFTKQAMLQMKITSSWHGFTVFSLTKKNVMRRSSIARFPNRTRTEYLLQKIAVLFRTNVRKAYIQPHYNRPFDADAASYDQRSKFLADVTVSDYVGASLAGRNQQRAVP